MVQNRRIVSLFENLFDGDPWLDVTIMGTLNGISAEKAARRPKDVSNSIWETVNHLVKWREVVLDRINGATADTPAHNYFLPVEDTSEMAWEKTRSELENSQRIWITFLENVSEEKLSERYLDSDYTVYDLVFGIMQHDAYHLGQLNLLVKYEL